MASIVRCSIRPALLRNFANSRHTIRVVSISTSKKDKDTSVTTTPNLLEHGLPEKFDARVTNKHWVSWGWDPLDREKDVTSIHIFFFLFITVFMVVGGYYIMYAPPRLLRDWAQREAYIQMHQKEQAGLPYIDRDLIPVATIELPSDEELGNTEIII